MSSTSLPAELRAVSSLAERLEGLELLVLFGSRGRGHSTSVSDWDIAYLGTEDFDVERLRAQLSLRLRTDRVDLVNLRRANGLLRYRVAKEGLPLFESRVGHFLDFWHEAVRFWCDAQPLLDACYDAVLARLDS